MATFTKMIQEQVTTQTPAQHWGSFVARACKLRHLDTNSLWIQQAARAKTIEYVKILGLHNPADMLTKHLSEAPRSKHAETAGIKYLPGRPKVAPELCSDEISALDALAAREPPPWKKPRMPPGKGVGSIAQTRVEAKPP